MPLITLSIALICAAFDELRNIRSIAQRTCNRVRVKVRTMVRVMGLVSWLGYWVSFSLRFRLWLGLDLRNWPNAQRVWSNAHIDQMRLTGLSFCFQISRKIYNLKRKKSMLKF